MADRSTIQRLEVGATPRECDVAKLLAGDLSVAEVAAALGVAVLTVRTHIGRLAPKIPGHLPGIARIVVWWRGGSRDVLGRTNDLLPGERRRAQDYLASRNTPALAERRDPGWMD